VQTLSLIGHEQIKQASTSSIGGIPTSMVKAGEKALVFMNQDHELAIDDSKQCTKKSSDN